MHKPSVRTLYLAGPLAMALASCSHEAPDPRTGPALVEVTTTSGSSAAVRTFSGIVSARVQSDIGFRVPGKVIERLVDTGQTVRRGQPLMRIDRTDYAFGATAANNTVDAARARAQQTAADEKRYRDLVSAGAVSASRYDQAKADADAARAQLAAALAQAGVARNEASYSVIVADSDGVVVETLAEPGQVVAAGQIVVRLAHAGPREATISLPETIRPGIGSQARASLYGTHDQSGSARLRQLSGAADPQTRTFDARYVLEGSAAQAPLGATVSISVPDSSQIASGAQIPLSAIYDNGHGPGVWKINDSGDKLTVHWSPVRVVALGEEMATISGGLAGGERFVALGAHVLHEGQAVTLSNTKLAASQ
ncbi:RND family efflux transporter MFP subunit [Novosphingobium sp. PhB165]|uniref:efflux RND transporter periplasmic adaptor subunit n=1 Tax=Novosphingobium sp. PhB165 TaxID=2485105 RepID=UPI001050D6A2|nr:efflux RND transporter periplasmic adaptor subunit [Novosphingobium sp. PhB165]TCM12724.1 RND family efflux transporter MFP subunit [Novosphingobium sp. PhB165]